MSKRPSIMPYPIPKPVTKKTEVVKNYLLGATAEGIAKSLNLPLPFVLEAVQDIEPYPKVGELIFEPEPEQMRLI